MISRLLLPVFLVCLGAIASSAQTCIPDVTLYNGLSVNLRPVDTDGDALSDGVGAVLHLHDMILRINNQCATGPVELGIRKSGTGFGLPADTAIWFDCTEMGTQMVEVWIRNSTGGISYTESYVIVQDADGKCFGPPPVVPVGCANDAAAPALYTYNGISAEVLRTGSNPPVVVVPATALVRRSYDECSENLQYRIRRSGAGGGVPATQSISIPCNELGTQLLEVWAGDEHDNWSFTETYIINQDNQGLCNTPGLPPLATGCSPDETAPTLLATNGLAQLISPFKFTRLYVTDFINTAKDKCSPFLTYRISKPGMSSGPPPPGATSLTFTCNELGTQLVEIWLADVAGNWTKAETYVIIQDNVGYCGRQALEQDQSVIPEFKKEIIRSMGYSIPEPSRRKLLAAPSTLSIWPNPVLSGQGGITLNTFLEKAGPVRVELYDPLGRLAGILADQSQVEAGVYQPFFRLPELSGGIYRFVLHTESERRTATVVVTDR